jgi:2-oxoglutarate dehydrogenase complex dehydrogenase (E1) component-like enzyme
VIICTGKVYYDLLKFREQQKQENTAILRVEELSPFPYAQLEAELVKYGDATTFRWVQEEPQNMGAWEFVNPRIDELLRSSLPNTQARVRVCNRISAALFWYHLVFTN